MALVGCSLSPAVAVIMANGYASGRSGLLPLQGGHLASLWVLRLLESRRYHERIDGLFILYPLARPGICRHNSCHHFPVGAPLTNARDFA
jgi:hypothetical protein